MDNEPPGSSNNDPRSRNLRRPRSASGSLNQSGSNTVIQPDVQDAALLAQFAAAAEMSSHGLPQHNPYGPPLMSQGNYPHPGSSAFHDHLFNPGDMGHSQMGHTQLPPLSSLDFPWNHFPPQPQSQQDHFDMQRTMSNPGMSTYPYGSSSHAPELPAAPPGPSTSRPSRRMSSAQNAVASSSASSPDPENQTEAERVAIAEEKRRRNTAASARFRIKKKQRTTNLERSVSDLTGRAEDLEREAADLRRENGWLKEIVMLKGSRLAGVNLSAQLESSQRAGEGSSQPAASGSKQTEPGSDDASSEEEAKAAKKKGKSRKK
ncbi:hypothetical protein Hypma_015195 [Hypsizygus marmoreus]|uniref:BZIP domain-containing protein n=1 Tax=Hypsizygus marmoreus TaxID=39966 RepID=A0A369KA59_HYPMA|nr:hypothetical protein Hypma_015195 [Hypsizygus marmoreus]